MLGVMPCISQVILPNASVLAIRPVGDYHKVKILRRHVADALQVPAGQISLLLDDLELEDDQLCGEVVLSKTSPTVTALKHPCIAKPTEYVSYIDGSGGPESGFVPCGTVVFPPPEDIIINMLPFIIGDIASVPQEFRHYWPLIESCPYHRMELGKVGYLTIHESLVLGGNPQRRSGLHTEAPGIQKCDGNGTYWYRWGGGFRDPEAERCGGNRENGLQEDELLGGIFMASSVAGSCRLWNVRIRDAHEVVGELGNLEHLRDLLGDGTLVEANQLIWFTDVTPHESLPIPVDTYRQYFRLVTSYVTGWYEQHSTANRLGITPDKEMTTIITDNKFRFTGYSDSEDDEVP